MLISSKRFSTVTLSYKKLKVRFFHVALEMALRSLVAKVAFIENKILRQPFKGEKAVACLDPTNVTRMRSMKSFLSILSELDFFNQGVPVLKEALACALECIASTQERQGEQLRVDRQCILVTASEASTHPTHQRLNSMHILADAEFLAAMLAKDIYNAGNNFNQTYGDFAIELEHPKLEKDQEHKFPGRQRERIWPNLIYADVHLERRIRRDTGERGRDFDMVSVQKDTVNFVSDTANTTSWILCPSHIASYSIGKDSSCIFCSR
ncbi:mediator of RNA polymerase II transcription subunit 25 [Tanacetum coccineum]